VASRFEIERVVGSGGMGRVFRAFDRHAGVPVALKVLSGDPQLIQRFHREARALASLNHPGIVRYVAHGDVPSGEQFLAMEWLEGEDLCARLARGPLAVIESVRLCSRVAEALAQVHAHGIVHRDIKPSNLFIPDGRLEAVKILDFGVARLGEAGALTQSGTRVGTPLYMAPEQVRGSREIDARVDVFALGCVLFECLSGRHAFSGENVMAVLAKILIDEPPRVRAVCPDAAVALDELVARMLAKEPAARPADAAQLAAEIEASAEALTSASAERAPQPPTIGVSREEQRMVSIVLLGRRAPRALEEARTMAAGDSVAVRQPLEAVVAAHGGRVEMLADGSAVVTLAGSWPPTDQAAHAARLALSVRACAPGVPIALATGRGLAGKVPVGEALDRAARELAAAGEQGIRLDALTARLLDAHFEVRDIGGGLVLGPERDVPMTGRTLIGRPTPFVGRDREMRTLREIFVECAAEPVARCVLVTGPPGAGKSRLRLELLGSLPKQEGLQLWAARGDPMRAGAPLGFVAPLVRQAAGLREGEPAGERIRKLQALVARRVPAGERRRVSEFLGELCGAPFPEEESTQLRAARRDPIHLSDQIRRAWEDWLAAECSGGPVVLVLEDLQWGDLPSVTLVDAALRTLRDRPLFVLALARPEVHDLFPGLWGDRAVQEVRLAELTARASERLVRAVLGEDLPAELVGRIIRQSEGNPFYLEELIRATTEGASAQPVTVLAMLQARLERLDAADRRVLRAASVFGATFWRGGAAAVAGLAQRDELDRHLEALEAREVIDRRPAGRFPGEREYAFRHALVWEAAYRMLTDEDRARAHRIAAHWLEATGERDALVCAEHRERGRDMPGAIEGYARAAQQALEASDLESAVARAGKGIACGAQGGVLGGLRAVQAQAEWWRGAYAAAESAAYQAIQRLEPGTAPWFVAVRYAELACGNQGKVEQVLSLADELLVPVADAQAEAARAICAASMSFFLLLTGRTERAIAILAESAPVAERLAANDPVVAGTRAVARATERLLCARDWAAALASFEESALSFERAGYLRDACMSRCNAGFVSHILGSFAAAERSLRDALALAERMGLGVAAALANHNLGLVLALQGRIEAGLAAERAAAEAYRTQGERRMEGIARAYLARILLLWGDAGAAESEARRAVDLLDPTPPQRPHALAVLATVLLDAGRPDAALAAAREAMGALVTLGSLEEGETLVRLAYVDALERCGEVGAARAALSTALAALDETAACITDGDLRQSFLENVPENARLRARGQALLLTPP
jgi:tetratricopeptide (TPR) repeat protein